MWPESSQQGTAVGDQGETRTVGVQGCGRSLKQKGAWYLLGRRGIGSLALSDPGQRVTLAFSRIPLGLGLEVWCRLKTASILVAVL